MKARMLLIALLVPVGAAYAGAETQAAMAVGATDFKMLSAGRGAVLVTGTAFVFDLARGTREALGPARRMAVNADKKAILLERRGEDGETLTVLDAKDHPRRIASAEIQVLVADIGYANYPPHGDFYIAWAAPGASTEAGQPIWGTYVLFCDSDEKAIDLTAAPMLSGLAPGPCRSPHGFVFSRTEAATFAASTMTSWVASAVLGKPFKSGDEMSAGHLLLVGGQKIVAAIPRTGPSSGRPIAFSEDGKRVMVWVPRLSTESDYAIIDMESGKTTPCTYIQGAGDVLAASGDLQQVVMQQDTRIYLVQAKGQSREVLKVPADRSAMADWVDGVFYVTDGESLWQVNRDGKVTQVRIP